MKKIFSIIGVIIALPLLAFALAFGGLWLVLDNPALFGQRLSAGFEQQTGFQLKINGDLNWQWLPPIGLSLNQIEIIPTNAEQPLASLKQARIDLKLLPLIFSNRLEINGIEIDGLALNAVIDAAGVANWQPQKALPDAIVKTPPVITSAELPTTDHTSLASSSAPILDIRSLSLKNTQVHYQDLTQQTDYTLNITTLSTGPLRTDQLTHLTANLQFEDKTNQTNVASNIAGMFAINQALSLIQLEDFIIKATINAPDQPTLKPTVRLNGQIDNARGTADFSDSALQLAQLNVDFNLKLNNIFAVPSFRGNLSIADLNARTLLATVANNTASMPTSNLNALTHISLNTDIAGTSSRITLNNFTAKIDQTTLTGNLGATISPDVNLTFNLAMDRFNPADYLPVEEPASPAVAAPTNTAATAATSTPAAAAQRTTANEDFEAIPVALLFNTGLDGRLSIKELNYQSYTFNNAELAIKNQQGKLKLNLAAEIYAGAFEFRLDLDNIVPGENPRGTTTLSLREMDLSQVAEIESIAGTIALDSKIRFVGNMLGEILASLDGWSRFTVDNGSLDITPLKRIGTLIENLRNLDNLRSINTLPPDATVQNSPVMPNDNQNNNLDNHSDNDSNISPDNNPDHSSGNNETSASKQQQAGNISQWPDRMPFKQLQGEHTINDGLLRDQQLSFASELFTVNGGGGLNYLANQLNYDFEIELQGTANSLFSINPRLTDIKWPIHCAGSLDDSVTALCLPDSRSVTQLAKKMLSNEVKNRGEDQLLEKVPEEYQDVARDLLDRLFN
ncbi:MAG: AsmA family protein [Pseudomonadales bacterium]|nr:AsmA family protein [Pseudomonadales bacterium]